MPNPVLKKRPPLRPPVGLPLREEGRASGIVASILLHLLILLLVAGPLYMREALIPEREGAGGPGPAGGGGGGRGGTGGQIQERVRFVQVSPPAAPAVKTETPVIKPPVIPPPQPVPQPVPQPTVPPAEEAKDASLVSGVGGGSGKDGSSGSGPGSGGGVGSGVGTGRGTGTGPGTGGGTGKIYPPTPTNLVILPIPVPSKVRPYRLVAFFDVDERGNTTLISFNPSKDSGYNKKIREMLLEFRFRPAVRADGTPVRDTTSIIAEAP